MSTGEPHGGETRLCFVHVGAPKTGTTAIQSFCAQNAVQLAREGICYPVTGRGADPTKHFNVALQLRGVSRYDPGAGSLDDLAAEIAASPQPHALISAEELSLLYDRPDALVRLRETLTGAGFAPRIVFYVREHSRYATAVFSEAIKFARLEPFSRYLESLFARGAIALGPWAFPLAFEPLVSAFADTFGREAVAVRAYREGGDSASLIEEFLETIGIRRSFVREAESAPAFANTRLTTGEAIAHLWAATAAHLGRPELRDMADAVVQRDPAAAGMPFDPLSEAECRAIRTRFADDARALINRWGVPADTFVGRTATEPMRVAAARTLFAESERRRTAVLDGAAGDLTLSAELSALL